MAAKFRLPRIRFGSSESSPRPSSPVTTYYLILVSAAILAVFGLLMTFSASAVTNISLNVNPYLDFIKTSAIIVVAVIGAFIAATLSPPFWRKVAGPLLLIGILMQILIIPFGIGSGGNTNWIPIPGTGMGIQPSEFLKVAVCIYLGYVLSQPNMPLDNWKRMLVAVGLPGMGAILTVMLGEDMGTALIFAAIILGAIWVAGVPFKWFPMIAAFGLGAAGFLVAINPSRTRRVISAIPGFGAEPNTSAPTQSDHGLWALGSGGLTGLGPGASREKWNYLPEAHTDFILAIIGEEFGLIGTLVLLATLAVLIWGILRMVMNSSDAFIRISSGGFASWLVFQALVNVGSVTGLAPVIGVPFPLVSYGGSAFLATALGIGVLLAFARYEAGMGRHGKSKDAAGRDPRISTRRRRAGRKFKEPKEEK